jgi:hypothetical protein
LCEGLEHLKIETRLIDERFPSVTGECELVTLKTCRLYLELHVNNCLLLIDKARDTDKTYI